MLQSVQLGKLFVKTWNKKYLDSAFILVHNVHKCSRSLAKIYLGTSKTNNSYFYQTFPNRTWNFDTIISSKHKTRDMKSFPPEHFVTSNTPSNMQEWKFGREGTPPHPNSCDVTELSQHRHPYRHKTSDNNVFWNPTVLCAMSQQSWHLRKSGITDFCVNATRFTDF